MAGDSLSKKDRKEYFRLWHLRQPRQFKLPFGPVFGTRKRWPNKKARSRTPKERRCLVCRLLKSASHFGSYRYVTNQKKVSARLNSTCRQCARERRRARHQQNREANLAACRHWREKNRERMLASRGRYCRENRQKLLLSRVISEQKRRLRGYNRCIKSVRTVIEEALTLARVGNQYLDTYSMELISKPTIDHIQPLFLGGTHVPDNVCVTSFRNNQSKGATPLLLWLVRRRAHADEQISRGS